MTEVIFNPMIPTPPAVRKVDPAAVSELLRAVGRFRRRVRRASPHAFDQGLSEAQAELLRLVARQPGIRVGEAAAELGLAGNTVSTLVSQLARRKLLLRKADPEDRRVGRLRLTASAQRRSDLARERRHARVAEAFARLDERTYAALREGARALSKVTELFDALEAGR